MNTDVHDGLSRLDTQALILEPEGTGLCVTRN